MFKARASCRLGRCRLLLVCQLSRLVTMGFEQESEAKRA